MVLIPAGQFQMGDTFNEGGSYEQPVHAVNIDAFYMDRYEVTNQQYADALNWAKDQGNLITVTSGVVYKYNSGTSYPYCSTTSAPTGWPNWGEYSQITWDGALFRATFGKENHPMVLVSWYGAVACANWRSAMQGEPLCYDLSTWDCDWGGGYRLPTEAEWEKAARGGLEGKRYPWGDAIDGSNANYSQSGDPFEIGAYPWTTPVGYYDGDQTPVGEDMANGFGLYDMAGNVLEWCNDWSGESYPADPQTNPHGPISGSFRVLRGGSWHDDESSCRSAHRDECYPVLRCYFFGGYKGLGFRLAQAAD